jgi:hypothetical protein
VTGRCLPQLGAYILPFTVTLAGTYSISLLLNNLSVPEPIYYRGRGPGTLFTYLYESDTSTVSILRSKLICIRHSLPT